MAEYEHKWFKPRLYGGGWRPVSWQGWATLIVYWAVLVALLIAADRMVENSSVKIISFIIGVAIATSLLVIICYKKGGPLIWRINKDNDTKTN